MARTKAVLKGGPRLTDLLGLGVVASSFPRDTIDAILAETGTESLRERDLPAHVMVYYSIAMTIFMDVSYGEVLRQMREGFTGPNGLACGKPLPGPASISRARSRLGAEPIRLLGERIVKPIATPDTPGAWFRRWRLVSIDGSCLDLPDEAANAAAFGRPGAKNGEGAFPQLRFVALVENGTHVLFGAQCDAYKVQEADLAARVLGALGPGMLCLADRGFYSYALMQQVLGQGADFLWRAKSNSVLPVHKPLPDGSYLSAVYPTPKDRDADRKALPVRVVEYRLGLPGATEVYRLVTTILDPQAAPAVELAATYQERWEIETALDEVKTHLRGKRLALRSKTPELVRQEFHALMLGHFAVRQLMHEAARSAGLDPDRLSYTKSIHVIRRKMITYAAFSPSGE